MVYAEEVFVCMFVSFQIFAYYRQINTFLGHWIGWEFGPHLLVNLSIGHRKPAN